MALLDGGRPLRDILPPINHPDFNNSRMQKGDNSRYSTMPALNISTAPLESPNTIYSGPPPPYSRAPSMTETGHGLSGYFSSSPSSTRHSKEDRDLQSSKTLPSLPSLHEALGADKPVPFSGPLAPTYSHAPGSTPSTAVGQNFPDVPRGPTNPFSHTAPPPSLISNVPQPGPTVSQPNVAAGALPEATPHVSLPCSSPLQSANNPHRSSAGSFSSINRPFESINNTNSSSYQAETNSHNPPFRDFPPQQPAPPSRSSTFNFESTGKFEDARNPFLRNSQISYGDTVKRHLEVYDAELALNEITETAGRTYEFSRTWSQRHHSNNRSNYIAESAPSMQEMDEIIRQQHVMLDNLNGLREAVIVQQTALSEQRARAARGHMEEDHHGTNDEYKTGGFAGGDAKKRRGKAAPPGRCHSCNRAETPEWRRGPDGARTLCNACGLHYAKLTRKLGANKASALTGSTLRPKGFDQRSLQG